MNLCWSFQHAKTHEHFSGGNRWKMMMRFHSKFLQLASMFHVTKFDSSWLSKLTKKRFVFMSNIVCGSLQFLTIVIVSCSCSLRFRHLNSFLLLTRTHWEVSQFSNDTILNQIMLWRKNSNLLIIIFTSTSRVLCVIIFPWLFCSEVSYKIVKSREKKFTCSLFKLVARIKSSEERELSGKMGGQKASRT